MSAHSQMPRSSCSGRWTGCSSSRSDLYIARAISSVGRTLWQGIATSRFSRIASTPSSMTVWCSALVSAVGSLRAKFAPTHFVFPDQFVDETKGRVSTFFGHGIVGHVPLAEPFCSVLSELMYKEARKLGIRSHLGGTYACMEGPGFSTRAESFYHRKMGYDIIGMTVATEAKLAREAGFHYVPVSLVTDYDCWKAGEEVEQEKVITTLKKNIENIRRLLVRAVPVAARAGCRTNCAGYIGSSVFTHRENFPRKTYKALKLLIG